MTPQGSPGKVYLIGAGPGDPGLLTCKAAEVLARCDVVFYDYLVNPHLLELVVPPSTPCIYVGKTGAHKGADKRQSSIHDLLLQHAQRGEIVARLKGGDPFVFGRGGEEAEILHKANIDVEIIPGITSAIAVPAYAGIPVTHRNFNTALAIVTGHEDPRLPSTRTCWSALASFAAAGGTLVILMGVKNLARNMSFLIAEGVPPSTPAAMVRWGTLPHQQVLTAQVHNLAQKVKEAKLTPPAVCVVGPTVDLRKSISWYKPRPMDGKRVLLTRPEEASFLASQQLKALGATPILLPTFAIAPPLDSAPLHKALSNLSTWTTLALTSANAVHAMMLALNTLHLDARALASLRLACVGASTASALASYALRADLVPERATAADLARLILQKEPLDQRSERVLALLAEDARPDLPDILGEASVDVDVVWAYRKVVPEAPEKALKTLLSGDIDAVLFASPGALRGLSQQVSPHDLDGVLSGAVVVCIGDVTARAARELGLRVDVVPGETSMLGMVEALKKHWEG